MVQWSDSFWGEGNRGFDLLSNNVKLGAVAIEEFQRFLTESSQCENAYQKALGRVQSQLTKVQNVGTFTPIWALLRELFEKISYAHLASLNVYQTLLDDTHNYQDVFQKKFKRHIQKDPDICRTADLIVQLQHAQLNVTKAKEQYHSLALDIERTKRISGNAISYSPANSENNLSNPISAKQSERLERKCRQAQDEYRNAIDKYNAVRNDYERCFHEACTKFQDFEIEHIEKLLAFSLNYSQSLHQTFDQIQQAQTDFHSKLKALTGNDLLEVFVDRKRTGFDRPIVLQFEEFDQSTGQSNSLLDLPAQQDDLSSSDQFDTSQALSPIGSVSHRNSGNDSPLTSSTPSMNNELSSNPFNLKIKKSKIPGIFGTNRKKAKKPSVLSTPVKTLKIPSQQQRQQNEETPATANRLSSDLENSFSLGTNKNHSDQRIGASISKSSSSSDSSDDEDDDIPMRNVRVTIKPMESKANDSTVSEADQEEKILEAMRQIAANIGDNSTNSRRLTPMTEKQNNLRPKSTESLATRLPPPVPVRQNTPVSINVISEQIDPSDVFSSNDQFHRSSSGVPERVLSNDLAANQPWISLPMEKSSASFSSSEDDKEVTTLSTQKLSPIHFGAFQRSSPISPTSNNRPSPSASPLTFEGFDRIPLAIAFQETINVLMSGDRRENWTNQIVGEMLISFPASIFVAFAEENRTKNALEFRLKNLDEISKINLKTSAVTQNDANFIFDMSQLTQILEDLQTKTPSSTFFNLSVLNYELKNDDVSSIPIQISAQWSRTFESISVTIHYRFHSSSLADSIRLNNNVIIISTIINEGQKLQESSPLAGWSTNEHKLWWKVAYTKNGTGNLSATIVTNQTDNELPLTTYSTINVNFLGENGLFSSIDFDLLSADYRVSLMKKKILSGKYQFEPDRREPVHLFRRPTLNLS